MVDGKVFAFGSSQVYCLDAATGKKLWASPLPGKAPVFAIITKVSESAGTFNYFLLYDEVVNTEKIIK